MKRAGKTLIPPPPFTKSPNTAVQLCPFAPPIPLSSLHDPERPLATHTQVACLLEFSKLDCTTPPWLGPWPFPSWIHLRPQSCQCQRTIYSGWGAGARHSETGSPHVYLHSVKGSISRSRRWELTPVAHMLCTLDSLLCTYFLF